MSKRVLNLPETGKFRLREFIVERITVIESGVNDRGSSGTGSWLIKVRSDRVNLMNVLVTEVRLYLLLLLFVTFSLLYSAEM